MDGAIEDASVRKEDGVKRKQVIGCAAAQREELEEEGEVEGGMRQEGTCKNMDSGSKVSLRFHHQTRTVHFSSVALHGHLEKRN